jgi:imidazolonepropionase-like amidohydrolase
MLRIALLFLVAPLAHAAIEPAPERAEGEGPWPQLILRGATLINGTGAPPSGPVDIVIEGNRIADIRTVGHPGLPIDDQRRPQLAEGGHEIDLGGHYVLPGFVDLHGHIGGAQQGTPAEYVYKLWLAHGITTVRDPGCGNGLDFCLSEKSRSERNRITAPRIHPYVFFGQGHGRPFRNPDEALRWLRDVAKRGAEGVKFFGYRPDIFEAALQEVARLGMRSAAHHAQLDVARTNALTTARWGLTTVEHWYGIPEALFESRTVQDYPAHYDYMNEQHRFAEAGRLWAQAAPPGSDTWHAVMAEMLSLDLTLNPTFGIYQATRDVMRARNADWHADYTLPSLWAFFQPSRSAHGSFFFDWGTEEEVAWRDNFRRWMVFVNEYKNRGGRVTVGSDSGYIYKVYGFGYIEELEMLREAGFHPLEVIRAATLSGAEALGAADRIGSVEVGKLADLVVIAENPLANLKVLYGTGHLRLSADNQPERVGGVRLTIKDGIVYDAEALLGDVRRMVDAAR